VIIYTGVIMRGDKYTRARSLPRGDPRDPRARVCRNQPRCRARDARTKRGNPIFLDGKAGRASILLSLPIAGDITLLRRIGYPVVTNITTGRTRLYGPRKLSCSKDVCYSINSTHLKFKPAV
jgi:hypothetical protein